MGKWIHRILALLVAGGYAVLFVGTRRFPALAIGLIVVGLLKIFLADYMAPTSRFGTERSEIGCLLYLIGWSLLLAPALLGLLFGLMIA
ncbi:MAG: hypothetical protein JXL80_12630 [Planctomycetes bacterium]|nr:hypothetical protein [Planctomycetota bacterium]